MGLLDHPHIVRMFYFSKTPVSLSLYLEDAGSTTLADHIAKNSPKSGPDSSSLLPVIQWERAVRNFARQIGSALQYCHSHCVHHNRLRADKIMVIQEGYIKLTGFGGATLVNPSELQCFDAFSYGTVLWYMLRGSMPWPETENWLWYMSTSGPKMSHTAWIRPGKSIQNVLRYYTLTRIRCAQSCHGYLGRRIT